MKWTASGPSSPSIICIVAEAVVFSTLWSKCKCYVGGWIPRGLNPGTSAVLNGTTLCLWALLCCWLLSSVPWPPLGASSAPNPKVCLQTLPNIPRGAKSPYYRTTGRGKLRCLRTLVNFLLFYRWILQHVLLASEIWLEELCNWSGGILLPSNAGRLSRVGRFFRICWVLLGSLEYTGPSLNRAYSWERAKRCKWGD